MLNRTKSTLMPNDCIRQLSNWADYLISIFGGFKLRNKTAIDSLYRIRTRAGTEIRGDTTPRSYERMTESLCRDDGCNAVDISKREGNNDMGE